VLDPALERGLRGAQRAGLLLMLLGRPQEEHRQNEGRVKQLPADTADGGNVRALEATRRALVG
jgi:hypothetical protein